MMIILTCQRMKLKHYSNGEFHISDEIQCFEILEGIDDFQKCGV